MRKLNKKGSVLLTLAIIVIMAVAIAAVVKLWMPGEIVRRVTPEGEPVEDVIVLEDKCPSDGITTVYAKLEDDYAASTTFITGLGSSNDQDGNLIFFDTTTNTIVGQKNTSSTAWVSQDMDCGNKAVVYALTDPLNSGSAQSEEFELEGNSMYVELHSNRLSKLTVKVKDITGDDWEYCSPDNNESDVADVTLTTGVDLNSTHVYDGTPYNNFSIGQNNDSYLDLEIYLRSATSRYYFNDIGMKNGASLGFRNFACVDLGGTTDGQEWDTDTLKVTVDGGSALPNVKSSIDTTSRDYLYLQQSETCYEIGDLDDSYSVIGFYVKMKDGLDPDQTDDDIAIHFLSEGFYESSDIANTILTGIYTDAATQVPVTHNASEVPRLLIQVD